MKDDGYESRLFLLGRVVATQGVMEATTDYERNLFLHRHQIGDWSATPQVGRTENTIAILKNFRVVSQHKTWRGETIWIITEADRSITTLLLPEEY